MCQNVGQKNFEPTFRNTLHFCDNLSENDMNEQDIVTLLRRWTHDPHAKPASDLMDEAADEIERLRAKISPPKATERYNHTGNCRRPDQR